MSDNAFRDENRITTLLGVSSVDGTTPVTLYADPTTHRLYVDLAAGGTTTVDAGTTTTLAPGASATVVNSGTTTDAVFDFGIPAGEKGDAGNAATIAIGTVTTVAPGAPATVTNSGTSTVAVFDFEIPEGDAGTNGTSFVWEDAYNGGTTYTANDVVSYNGSSYICILESIGNLPTNATYWSLMAQKGSDGAGSGDVMGPATNTDSYIPQWDGANSKTLKNGIPTSTFSTTDEKVKYDAGDATAGYVADKIVAGTGISVAEGSGATENKLVVTSTITQATRDSLGLDTDDSPQFAGIELGHASDTTLSRVSAGRIAVEGVNVPTISSTDTFTNKTIDANGTGNSITNLEVADFASGVIDTDLSSVSASDDTIPSAKATKVYVDSGTKTLTNTRITPRVSTEASSATPTINTDNVDAHSITALAADITSMTTNLSGTPTNFQKLIIRIKDDGTARAIAWGASFEAKGVALPTTTVISKVLTVGFIYDTVTSKWGCVASSQEA